MFKFIKKLFNKEKENKVTVDISENGSPVLERDESLETALKDLDETAARVQKRIDERHANLNEELKATRKNIEQSEILLQRGLEIQSELDRMLKDLGIVHKFRDTTTGEIYEVEPDDHETFNKMMCNKNMQMLFG